MSFIKDGYKDLAYWISSNEGLNTFLQISTIIATIAISLYEYNKDKYGWSLWVGLVLLFVVVLSLVFKWVARHEYGTIKLFYKRGEGYLFDQKTNYRNVTLRCESLGIIFKHLCNKSYCKECEEDYKEQLKESLHKVGYDVGKSFYESYSRYLITQHKNFDTLQHTKKIYHLLEYDSSSGMGHFKHTGSTNNLPAHLQFTLTNSFTSNFEIEDVNECDFLAGYLSGVCSEIFKDPNLKIIEVKCRKDPDENFCVFEIE